MELTRCECGWKGRLDEVLVATNPFDPDDKIYGCPYCKSINTLRPVCDVLGCWREVACGFPTPDGYRRTCGKHYREYQTEPKPNEAVTK